LECASWKQEIEIDLSRDRSLRRMASTPASRARPDRRLQHEPPRRLARVAADERRYCFGFGPAAQRSVAALTESGVDALAVIVVGVWGRP
jgi:hypothetical protein